MKLYILVEGKSEQVFLEKWLQQFIPQHTFHIITHQGKGRLSMNPSANPLRRGLLDQLPMKLRAYGRSLNPETERLLILIDQDEDDCRELKSRIEKVLEGTNPKPHAKIRIAVKETEAFYLGNRTAMHLAYPKMQARRLEKYDPTSAPEMGTWELFAEMIGDSSENKVDWAEAMGNAMKNPKTVFRNNRSPSFRQLCRAIRQLVGEPSD